MTDSRRQEENKRGTNYFTLRSHRTTGRKEEEEEEEEEEED